MRWLLEKRAPVLLRNDSGPRGLVVDTGNRRVVRVGDMAGTAWTTLGTPGIGVSQFTTLSGVFVDEAAGSTWLTPVTGLCG